MLTLKELDTAICRFITDDYHQREHPEIRATPHHACVGDGWLPRLPATIDELNLWLLAVAKTRSSTATACISRVSDTSRRSWPATCENRSLSATTPDITEIRVFHKNQFVCRAVDPDHETSTLTLKDIQAAPSARRRELRRQINQRIAVMARHLPDSASAKPTPARALLINPRSAQRYAPTWRTANDCTEFHRNERAPPVR